MALVVTEILLRVTDDTRTAKFEIRRRETEASMQIEALIRSGPNMLVLWCNVGILCGSPRTMLRCVDCLTHFESGHQESGKLNAMWRPSANSRSIVWRDTLLPLKEELRASGFLPFGSISAALECLVSQPHSTAVKENEVGVLATLMLDVLTSHAADPAMRTCTCTRSLIGHVSSCMPMIAGRCRKISRSWHSSFIPYRRKAAGSSCCVPVPLNTMPLEYQA